MSSSLPLASTEQLRALSVRARRERVPLAGAFDLTYRCNLRCVHCYAGHLVARPRSQAGEMATHEVVRVFEEAAAAGCLLALLSGGEPLLRPDFAQIYTAARKQGLIVTVFTNATLVTDSHLDALSEYPPRMVEVSLYGATQSVYERITGVPGSHARALRGIERLAERGIRLGIKTVVISENLEEIEAVGALARAYGAHFRVDPHITPRLDGSRAPLALRTDPERGTEFEMSDEKDRRQLASLCTAYAGRPADTSEHPGRCGAGLTAFHIDPTGVLRPCLISRHPGCDVRGHGFSHAWEAIRSAMDGATERLSGCIGCPDILLCGYCPALFELEEVAPTGSEYACLLGKNRRRLLEERGEVESVCGR